MPFSYSPAPEIIPWPARLRFNQLTVHLQFHTTRFDSPFTRSTQTQELPGARFIYSAGLPPLDRAETRLFRATIARGRGSVGRYYLPAESGTIAIPEAGQAEPVSVSPLTVDNTRVSVDSTHISADAQTWITSTVLSAADGGDSSTIFASANQPSGTVVIEAGRHISFDAPDGWRQLCIVVRDAVVEAGSLVRIAVEPPMRLRPARRAPLHIRVPSGIFMFTGDDQGLISQAGETLSRPSIEAVEARPMRITVP